MFASPAGASDATGGGVAWLGGCLVNAPRIVLAKVQSVGKMSDSSCSVTVSDPSAARYRYSRYNIRRTIGFNTKLRMQMANEKRDGLSPVWNVSCNDKGGGLDTITYMMTANRCVNREDGDVVDHADDEDEEGHATEVQVVWVHERDEAENVHEVVVAEPRRLSNV